MAGRRGDLVRKMDWGTEQPLPGWSIHYVAAQDGYAFSLSDTRDPCQLTFASNDGGVIVEGRPADRRGQVAYDPTRLDALAIHELHAAQSAVVRYHAAGCSRRPKSEETRKGSIQGAGSDSSRRAPRRAAAAAAGAVSSHRAVCRRRRRRQERDRQPPQRVDGSALDRHSRLHGPVGRGTGASPPVALLARSAAAWPDRAVSERLVSVTDPASRGAPHLERRVRFAARRGRGVRARAH